MGSIEFMEYGEGTDPDSTFQHLTETALAEHGNDPYAGSIAQKNGYVIITDRVLPLSEAEAMAQRLMGDEDERIRDKDGPAGAIAYTQNTPGRPARALPAHPGTEEEQPQPKPTGWLFFGMASW